MERTYLVYIHTNKTNNKKYIGITGQKTPNDRWHNGTNYYHNQHFRSSIKKYGWDNFEHEIYATGLTGEEASELEKELISKYKTTDDNYGYNLDSGGSRTTHSEETRRKMSQSALGRKVSEETREKLRIASTGNKNSVGKKQTEEAKQKNREAHLGKTHALTEEQKMHIMYGHKSRKEVVCIETGMEFPSIGQAAKYAKTSQGAISGVLSGRSKTAGGYHWRLKNDNTKSNDYPVRE